MALCDQVWRGAEIKADVLVIGGGIAGCWAAISAAKKGLKVVLVDKAHVRRSGAGGSGCDHWQFAATNPACRLTPEELTQALVDNHGGWNCGIHRYIQCREGWDALQELETMGVRIRDVDGEFRGADFRDEKTGLLFGYDYENRYTLRFWGTRAKPALEEECKRLGVDIYNRIMATSLLTEGGKQGGGSLERRVSTSVPVSSTSSRARRLCCACRAPNRCGHSPRN